MSSIEHLVKPRGMEAIDPSVALLMANNLRNAATIIGALNSHEHVECVNLMTGAFSGHVCFYAQMKNPNYKTAKRYKVRIASSNPLQLEAENVMQNPPVTGSNLKTTTMRILIDFLIRNLTHA